MAPLRVVLAAIALLSAGASTVFAQGTGTISVTVRDGSGGIVPNASIVLLDSRGRRLSSSSSGAPILSVWHNLPPGTYTLLTSAPGFATELYHDFPCPFSVCEPTSGTLFSVAAGETFNASVVLSPGGRIAGTVSRATGGAVSGVVSVALHNSFGIEIAGASIGSNGAYGFGGLSAGSYYLRTSTFSTPVDHLDELYGGATCVTLSGQPNCRVTDGIPVTVTAGAVTTGVDFSLDPGGRIEGLVSSGPPGAPRPGVTVTAFVGNTMFGRATTDLSGRYVITGLPSSTYIVRTAVPISHPFVDEWFDDVCVACGGAPRGVAVTAGVTTSGIDFELRTGGSLSGTLSFPTLPFTGWVTVPSVEVYDARNVLVRSAVPVLVSGSVGSYVPAIAAGGTFAWRADGLPTGTYYLRTSNAARPGIVIQVPSPSSGWLIDELYHNTACVAVDCLPTQGTPVAVTAGAETTGIDFALEYGAVITGHVRTSDANSFFRLPRVRVYDARGVELMRSRVMENYPVVTGPTADPGVYSALGLPAGTYYLKMDAPSDGRFASELYKELPCDACSVTSGTPVVVRAGETRQHIDFIGLPPYGFSGRVEALGTGTGLQGVTVRAYTPDDRLVASAISGFDGRFYVRGLSGGDYIYRTVNQLGFVEAEGVVTTPTSGADTCCVTIALAAGQTVSGSVRDPAGAPIPNAPVLAFTSSTASPVARAATNTLGEYSLTLAPGEYGFFTDPIAGFRQELYNDVPCPLGVCDPASATRVNVSSAPVAGVDFSLAACSTMSIAPLRLANAAAGSRYRQTLGVAGGTPGFAFRVLDGALPPGLVLDGETGVLSGTPASAGAFSFTVGASDSTGCAAARTYSLDVPACAFVLGGSSVSLRARGEPWLISIANPCGDWTATPSEPWIEIRNVTSSFVIIVALPNTSASSRSGYVTIGPRLFTVHQSGTIDAVPFGVVDTPLEGVTVRGSIAVSGWALDDLGVSSVLLYRDPVAGETPGQQVFVGVGTFVEGARPDVEAIFAAFPRARRAGWGYLLLTNMLPNRGNGTFRLHAYAQDSDLQRTLIGSRTITAANSTADAPFGAIDTPAQGETISGPGYVNWGWALTPQPNMIPANGSSIQVYVDGVALGTITYNLFRPDVSGLFPGLQNSGGPVGYRAIDTTTLSEGMHTIAWVATDTSGHATGIGSRFFTVNNSAWTAPASGALRGEPAHVPATVAGIDLGRQQDSLAAAPASPDAIGLRRDETGNWLEIVKPAQRGERMISIRELERVEIDLAAGTSDSCASTYAGYLVANGQLRELPVGSALDAGGHFYWQPGPGFVGPYRLLFVRTACDGSRERMPVRISIGAR